MEDTLAKYELIQKEFLKDKYLVRTPYPTIGIIVLYLYIVFIYGPSYMKGKKAFQLKNVILVYDVIQIFLNFSIAYSVITELIATKFSYTCTLAGARLLTTGYNYYLLKVFDLTETVFFVLKQKKNQISFLHVYHHVLILLLSYIGLNMLGAGHCALYGVVNCIVHIIMYTYYFISAYKPDTQYIRLKKFVTQMQLLQFVFLLMHTLWPFIFGHCRIGRPLSLFGISQAVVMIYLFGSFYVKTYMRKSVQKQEYEQ